MSEKEALLREAPGTGGDAAGDPYVRQRLRLALSLDRAAKELYFVAESCIGAYE